MADATAPYCTTANVKALLPFLDKIGSATFSATVPPTDPQVTFWVNQAASRIDQAYASAGYVIPFSAIAGETWPTHQTSFLTYFNAVGVAAMLASPASSPQIADMRSSRRDRSQYGQEWDDLLNGVKAIARRQEGETLTLLRAQARTGSAAEYMLATPYPPLSDFLEGYRNPMDTDLMREFTERYRKYYRYVKSLEVSPDVDPLSVEWLYWWHSRLGGIYD